MNQTAGEADLLVCLGGAAAPPDQLIVPITAEFRDWRLPMNR